MAKKQSNPYLAASSGEELAPTQRLAHDIVALRRDLMPSVERIMNAGLGEATIEALGLFQRALGDLADPNRDPAVAIDAVRTGRQIVHS